MTDNLCRCGRPARDTHTTCDTCTDTLATSTKCRRCSTQKSMLTNAEDDVRRIARQMARTQSPSRLAKLNDDLTIAKANRTEARRVIDRGHDCDNDLSDKHWTRIQGAS